MRIAVIGGGISGIASSHVLKKFGFSPVIFESSQSIGGVWSAAYPNVHLQNIFSHYHISDIPWPSEPDFHPSGEQIFNYLKYVVEKSNLEVRLNSRVLDLIELPKGWLVNYSTGLDEVQDRFDFVMICTGQYTQRKIRPEFVDERKFNGKVITELDVKDLDIFEGKNVAVVGFGKSALDMATFAAQRASTVNHIFRTPRWLLPERILGVHFTRALFSRFGSVMMPSWVQPSSFERVLHRNLSGLVRGFWSLISLVFQYEVRRHSYRKGGRAKQWLKIVEPKHDLLFDLGSKTALAPEAYLPMVAAGKIIPNHAELKGFDKNKILLSNGKGIQSDLVLLCLGFDTPLFPFLPEKYRVLLESESDGYQLYRHMIHPHIPNMAFAGFNHGFMHVPTIEIGTLWVSAMLNGELVLPSLAEMEKTSYDIQKWKRTYINYDPARSYSTSTRYQQYIDVLLKDLGVSPYRKMPNILNEVFGRYKASDYAGVFTDYNRRKKKKTLKPIPVNT